MKRKLKPSNSEFGKIFDGIASRYETICNVYTTRRRQEFVERHASGSVLEVGCADGVICGPLKDSHRLMACDISEEMVRQARQRGIEAVRCDAEELPFEDRSFDTIVASEVIYYLDRPERFLAEAKRVLKPEGRLLMTIPSATGQIADRVRAFLRELGFSKMYFDDGIRRFMSLRQIKRLIAQTGFRNVKTGKMILVPSQKFDAVNRFIEATPLKYLALFSTVLVSNN